MNKQSIISLIITVSVIANLLLVFSQSIRLDEAQSIWVSTKSVTGLLKINAQDVQTPLYSLLLHFWLQILGTDIITARILSLIFFTLTLYVLYEFFRESTTETIALLALVLFSLSPFIMWYSNEARTYTLFTFIVGANHLFFLRLVRSHGHSSRFGYLLATIFGMFTHYFFFFILLVQVIYIIFRLLKNIKHTKLLTGDNFWQAFKKHSRLPLTFLLILLISAGAFLPWIIYVYHSGLASNTQPLLVQPTSYNLIQIFINFLFGFQSPSLQSLMVSLWPLSIIVIFFIFTRKNLTRLKNLDYFVLATFVPVVLDYLISLVKPAFLPRYLILITPTLFALIAWILINYNQKLFSIVTVTILFLTFISLVYQNRSNVTPVKEDYRNATNYVSQTATSHDIVAVTAPFTTFPIEYSYTGLAKIATIPLWNRYVQGPIPPFSQDRLVQQLDAYKSVYERIFVIFSYDQGYEKNIRNYLDQHFQMLKDIKYSPNIELRIYKLRYDVPDSPLPPPSPTPASSPIKFLLTNL